MDEKTTKYLDSRSYLMYPSSGSRKVLIFTSDFYVEFAYRSILGNLGYELVSEEKLLQAKKCMLESTFEFIVVDLQDEKKDGFRFLDFLWAESHFKKMPVYVNRPPVNSSADIKQLRRYKRLRIIENERLLLSELFFGDLKINESNTTHAG